jgi:hypothetical protein
MSYSEFIDTLQAGNSVFFEIKGYGAYITVQNNEIVCEVPELEWGLSFNGSKLWTVYQELYLDCSGVVGLAA